MLEILHICVKWTGHLTIYAIIVLTEIHHIVNTIALLARNIKLSKE